MLAFATVVLAVGIAGAFATTNDRGTQELPAFFVWSLPLGVAVWTFARRSRFARLAGFTRCVLAATIGLIAGVGLTLVGWLLVGGWMLVWNFPVLYCWSIAGILGMAAAVVAHGAARPKEAAGAVAVALVPLAVLWSIGTRPTPAVLIVYRDSSGFDAAQYVLDSVLSVSRAGRTGRDLRWPYTSYARTVTASGETAALIQLQRVTHRDSIRAALAGNPLVKQVRDTMIPR